MKTRIICLCLCIAALGLTMLLAVSLINSEEYVPPVIGANKDKDKDDDPINPILDATDTTAEVALNANSIASFADRVERFIDTLAYGSEKNFEDLDYIIDNLDRVSDYLSSAEMGDKTGSEYIALLSNSFKTARTGFIDDSDFSAKVSSMLVDIDSYALELSSENKDLYPTLDTSVGGSVTLAMLSLYEKSSIPSDCSAFTVTVGGSVLLGDNLGTSESKKFSAQFDKYKYSFPFYGISSVTASDDMTIIALEAPLTDSVDPETTNPAKGAPDYADRLLGIDAVSIASSNVMVYGEKGLEDTANALEERGISYSVQQSSASVSSDFGKVVYITFDLTDTAVTQGQKEINQRLISDAVTAERVGGADIVIVLIHWNTRQRDDNGNYLGDVISKYEPHFDVYNKEIARAAIGDGVTGADLVVGYGSRVAQGIESWNGKMIVYETGDLTYSGGVDSDMEDTDLAFLFRQTFVKSENGVKVLSYRIIPIVNTTASESYRPQLVFDERADKVIENLIRESSYFTNKITEFNYIKISK